MTERAITVAERAAPPQQTDLNREEIDLLKSMVAADTTDAEFQLFIRQIHRTGLDPFARQIHCVKLGGKLTIQTGIDGYRLIACRTGQLAGIEDAVFDTETQDTPNKASVTVYRFVQGERVPYTASARWKEYMVPNSPLWRKMPYAMLAKCAESLALRKAFPQELSGIYTETEMGQAEAEPPVRPAPAPRRVTPSNVDPVTGEIHEPAPAPRQERPVGNREAQVSTATPTNGNGSKVSPSEQAALLEKDLRKRMAEAGWSGEDIAKTMKHVTAKAPSERLQQLQELEVEVTGLLAGGDPSGE